jgi:hypothetical protein
MATASSAVIGGGLWLSNAAGSNQTWHPTNAPAPVRVDPPKANPPAPSSRGSAEGKSTAAHKPQHVTRR